MIQAERPSLVITDFMMPLMTGLELAQALKATPEYRDLPIVLMSGAQGTIARDHHELFAVVFDKPLRKGHLLEQLRKLTDFAR
ncbi:response regulator [Microvirga vignae]|uniref:response regulator n=1 Tax=Microvirga vignae TaxID=1225564 RepID=UPI000A7EDE37|nr:response regulator [Microvirga vignae]